MARTLTPADLAPVEFNPQQDEYRQAILRMLNALHYPQGWRVVMSMDGETEKIRLEVQVGKAPFSFRIFGTQLFDRISRWETRREMSATTYQALYLLLKTQPEFLEMHTVIGSDEFTLATANGSPTS
jgi:hypothetical protein